MNIGLQETVRDTSLSHHRLIPTNSALGSGFASNAGPLAQDLNMYESYVLAAFPGNSTATREYSNAASDWETLSNDQSTSRFFP